ncbi:cytosolic Fe-S cluster assembly factor nar-1 [Gaeumannomyces tritici R3-111a-1]|uniref:Cytosolic Fe-S cluster assembly factor NAR1 n=1 Tax=Gaeumannomyces tritici (strain R3-111a-1) TaxID=644352 RepID=J3P9M1_GAET3|nr:cytosolic Fe-S cluster assembly factor nar-1 [Gaeumannomyces tritici R3-111a-1]EJT73357.1 cytosolic Fe-S cluster assembly factor nar-1 [Gaeumannomyces tritici R3-111a-1]
MSAILSVDDLNDFISPGVACIKPVETLPPSQPAGDPTLEHEVILDGQPGAASSAGAGAPAQISLTDCLACSGCVTSAEAVLVSLQSHSELLSVLDSAPALQVRGPDAQGRFSVDGLEDPARRLFVASVSPQSRASLAAACSQGVSESQAGRMLDRLLMGPEGLMAGGKWGNRFEWVVDTNAARDACLLLGADEVLGRNQTGDAALAKKPILTASCPGWVCYAEKTHPHVLPHLSRVKSPQALTGTLIKTTLSRVLNIPPDRIWHLSIMPCFDKKLEASREELTEAVWAGNGAPGRGTRDVDCVITSKEIFMLTESRSIDFFSLPASSLRQQLFPDSTINEFFFPQNSRKRPLPAAGSSGGNLYYILQDVLSAHAGSRLETARGRNVDVVEYTVVAASGETLFRAARYYGFRNIQNLVRKLKPAKPSRMPGGKPFGSARRVPTGRGGGGPGGAGGVEHAYIEVMACPGGCTNGGGQVKADDQVVATRRGFPGKPGPQEQKQFLAEVDEAYFSADDSTASDARDEPSGTASQGADGSGAPGCASLVDGINQSFVRNALAHWAEITGVPLDKLVFTSYREVISDVGKTNITDSERVVQLAGKIGGGW